MQLNTMFQIQRELDDRIREQHGLIDTDLVPKKLLALQTEIAELANETRCFKYWSHKSPSPTAVVLEEYVDALHFVLSLGLDLGMTDVDVQAAAGLSDLTEAFLLLNAQTAELAKTRHRDAYVALFNVLLGLGEVLGFSAKDIETAYLAKNEVNHRRQSEGY